MQTVLYRVSSIICLKKVLWNQNNAYSYDKVHSKIVPTLFVLEYPHTTFVLISTTMFALGN